jgi:hypothetical protein
LLLRGGAGQVEYSGSQDYLRKEKTHPEKPCPIRKLQTDKQQYRCSGKKAPAGGSLGETRRIVKQDGKHGRRNYGLCWCAVFLSVFRETMQRFCRALLFPFLLRKCGFLSRRSSEKPPLNNGNV